MNEIANYDPETYHATLTHSVYVRLEGSIIRLSKPNRNIARRATHNEPKPDVTYISQKIYDLTNSNVSSQVFNFDPDMLKQVHIVYCLFFTILWLDLLLFADSNHILSW